MPETPSKMHMYDMMKINTIVFEIVRGGGLLKPPARIVSSLKYPESKIVKGYTTFNRSVLRNITLPVL